MKANALRLLSGEIDADFNNPIVAMNARLARQINQEARANPGSPYVNKYVGIANGKVVVVADTLRELSERLKQIEPDPAKRYAVDASADYDTVEEIWADYDTV